MGWTPEGNKKAHNTLKKRLGQEGYILHMQTIAARGGKANVKKGFAITKKQLDRVRRTARPEFDGTGHIPEPVTEEV